VSADAAQASSVSSVNASVASDQNAVATGSLATDASATGSSSLSAASGDASQLNPYTAQPNSSPYLPDGGSDPYSPAGSSSVADPYTGGQSVDAFSPPADQVSSSPLNYSPADPGQVSSPLDYTPADPGQVSSPLNYTPADPLNYTPADGSDAADAADGQGSDDQSAAGSATPSSGPRPPDYVTLEVSGGYVLTVGVAFTFASDGNVFIGPEFGVGVPGISGTLEGGWIDQTTEPTPAQIDSFVSGWSVGLGGYVPVLGGVFGPAGAEVWGQPGNFDSSSFGTQVGVGAGVGVNASLLGSYSWLVGTWK